MRLVVFITLVVKINLSVSVIPARLSHSEQFLEDVDDIKKNIQLFSEHLDKLNTIYLTHIEPRLLVSATQLENIGSNVKNLQERAHIWDTFQLHVAAWNDQMASFDRKIDIISKGQEKILTTQAQIDTIQNIEYKIERVFKKLEGIDDTLVGLNKNVLIQNSNQNMLFGEYTTRGILSTLKTIERKVDSIQLSAMVQSIEQNKLVKCTSSSENNELLGDISSKVDIIFDKTTKEDIVANQDFLDEQHNYTQIHDNLTEGADLKKCYKMCNQPFKQMNKGMEELLSNQQVMQNNTEQILEKMQTFEYNDIIENFANIINNFTQIENDRQADLINLLKKERFLIEDVITQICNKKTPKNDVQNINKSSEYIAIKNATTCEDLTETAPSGVYCFNFTIFSYCDIRDSGKWTVIQRRGFSQQPHNFSMNWNSYKHGFGDLHKDFWYGNDFIHRLSEETELVLRIELEDFDGNTAWAQYTTFKVLSEGENYALLVGGYSGNASDSLSSHNGSSFSTNDVKNDQAPECCPCAVTFGGGWWFNSCFESNLNGPYYSSPQNNDYYKGIIWEYWLGNYSLKKTQMLVKTRARSNEINNHTDAPDFIPYYEDP